MHQTQKNGEAARCISPNRYSIVKVQEPESRVHRKVQARVREGADENVPQGNASPAYFTPFWQKHEHVPWGTGKHPLLRTTLLNRLPLLVSPHGRRASGLDEGRTPSMYGGECPESRDQA